MEKNLKSEILSSFTNLLHHLESLKNETTIIEFLGGVLKQYVNLEEPKHAEIVTTLKQEAEKVHLRISAAIQCKNEILGPTLDDNLIEAYQLFLVRELKKLENAYNPFQKHMLNEFSRCGQYLLEKFNSGRQQIQLLKESLKNHINFCISEFPKSLEKPEIDLSSFAKSEMSTLDYILEENTRYELASICLKIKTFLTGMPMEQRTLKTLESILNLLEVSEADKIANKFWPTIEYFDNFHADEPVLGFLGYRVELTANKVVTGVATGSIKALLVEEQKSMTFLKEFVCLYLSSSHAIEETFRSLLQRGVDFGNQFKKIP